MIRRPTLRDIAKVVGVTHATVSCALRNDPRFPLATRHKIQAVAKKLGYRPDPMLSAMSAYRQGIELPKYRGVLGWIENHPTRDGCKKVKRFAEFFRGASERAKELGYALETFWMRDPGLTLQRLTSMLIARNIQGILIAPLPLGRGHLRLPWEHFSVVAIGHGLIRPPFHIVAGNQYLAIMTTLHKLRALGYRRIGFVSHKSHSESVDYNLLAAFETEQKHLEMKDRIPALITKKEKTFAEPEFLSWYKQHMPKAIITTIPEIFEMLKKIKEKIPKDAGFAVMNMPWCLENFSGINTNAHLIGRVATDFLVNMIHRHEKGIPKVPQRLLVEGTWIPGKTLRRVNVV